MNELKIVGLKVDGFQKLSAVEMKFPTDGGCIYIRGGNGEGKTALIDFLWWMFDGNKILNPEKIQHGKEKIKGQVDIGEYLISREYSQKSERLNVLFKPDNFSVNKPQTFLSKLRTELTFNPFPFLNLPAEKKLKFMMDFLKIDFTGIDLKIANHEQERLFVGREIKSIGEIEEVPEVKPVNVGNLLEEKNRIQAEINAELEEIRDYNRLQENRNFDMENAKGDVEYWETEIERIQEELKIAVERHGAVEEKLKSLTCPEPIRAEITSQNTADIDLKILNAQQVNLDHEKWKQKEEKRIQKEAKELIYQNLTRKIESLKVSKKEKLSETDTGVDGLEIRETGLYYQGTFLENCSDSEKLRISMMLCQAMKPPLKAVFLDRGESFDQARIKEIERFAAENDIQVFITQVADEIPDEIPSNVFYIVEGEIKK